MAGFIEKESQVVEVPQSFPFPFTPYEIQIEFMRHLYETLEKGKIGIFESPTGTGKSLSLICGSLKWLADHNERERERTEAILSGKETSLPQEIPPKQALYLPESQKANIPDWFLEYDRKKALKEKAYTLQRQAERKTRKEERIKKLKEQYGHSLGFKGHLRKEPKADSSSVISPDPLEGVESTGDDDVILDEYFSDGEGRIGVDDIAAADSESSSDESDEDHPLKIFYASRTHSQLSQFVHEIQKTPYKDSISVVPLGSRGTYCINERVRKLKSITLMNDRCLELKRNKSKSSTLAKGGSGCGQEMKRKRHKSADRSGCPFNKPTGLETLRDLSLGRIQDVEELVSIGKELGACPYYATRHAVPDAQVVVLPYNSLLHAGTREALGIKLKGSVIIIDEAHNLLDTIASIHSVFINHNQLRKCLSQLEQYRDRYRGRLNSKNLLYINQILNILKQFIKLLDKFEAPPHTTSGDRLDSSTEALEFTELLGVNEFLRLTEVDNINMFKILRYCRKSEIAKKLNGFVQKYCEGTLDINNNTNTADRNETTPTSTNEATPSSPMVLIEQFLEALTTGYDKDSRIIIKRPSGSSLSDVSSLRYLLLNPSLHFTDIVNEAHSIILAGGTMEPISEFKDQLFTMAGVGEDRLQHFSCGHVIGCDRLLPIVLGKGPSGIEFDFTFHNRTNMSMIDELGRTIANVCMVVPGGVVCFFPSYEYERRVYNRWVESGQLGKINKKKQIFREPKLASQVDQVLNQYGRCIEFNNKRGGASGLTGAMILCVVGGKLSEGINFADDLGRCVIMVGLPYPNMKSPELREKIEYLNTNSPPSIGGKSPGQTYYENLCMKAVNQSIGRAIRHSNDYAAILLVDHRYSSSHIYSKLPKWIESQLMISRSFGNMFGSVHKFFSTKKED